MMASPAAMGAGFMEARTIEAAAASEAANGEMDRCIVWPIAAVDTRGCLEAAYEIESFQSPISISSDRTTFIYLEFTAELYLTQPSCPLS